MKRLFLAVLALAAIPWTSSSPAGARAVSFRADVAPILATSCGMISCHGGGLHPPEFTPDASPTALRRALAGVPSEERPASPYVKPGDPDGSYLIDKIEGHLVDALCEEHDCGERMPARNPALSQAARRAVREWIARGARDD